MKHIINHLNHLAVSKEISCASPLFVWLGWNISHEIYVDLSGQQYTRKLLLSKDHNEMRWTLEITAATHKWIFISLNSECKKKKLDLYFLCMRGVYGIY
jgi:hypothetical protein